MGVLKTAFNIHKNETKEHGLIWLHLLSRQDACTVGLYRRSVQGWLPVQQQNISVLYVSIHLNRQKITDDGTACVSESPWRVGAWLTIFMGILWGSGQGVSSCLATASRWAKLVADRMVLLPSSLITMDAPGWTLGPLRTAWRSSFTFHGVTGWGYVSLVANT